MLKLHVLKLKKKKTVKIACLKLIFSYEALVFAFAFFFFFLHNVFDLYERAFVLWIDFNIAIWLVLLTDLVKRLHCKIIVLKISISVVLEKFLLIFIIAVNWCNHISLCVVGKRNFSVLCIFLCHSLDEIVSDYCYIINKLDGFLHQRNINCYSAFNNWIVCNIFLQHLARDSIAYFYDAVLYKLAIKLFLLLWFELILQIALAFILCAFLLSKSHVLIFHFFFFIIIVLICNWCVCFFCLEFLQGYVFEQKKKSFWKLRISWNTWLFTCQCSLGGKTILKFLDVWCDFFPPSVCCFWHTAL